MTCIVGLIEDNTIYIGGDSALDTTSGIIRTKNPKVYKKGEFIFGVAGYLSVINALTHVMVFPPCYEHQDPFEYIVNNFIPSYRSALHEQGLIEMENGIERNRSELLLGFRGHLFSIGTDFSVLESQDNYIAIGSGAVFAMGAFHGTKNLKLEPDYRIHRALEAATDYDECVLEPYEIESLEYVKSDDFIDKILTSANEKIKEEE
ncbi:MAG: hypothetical protein ABFD07_16135 [Methanobacterium sp.]